MLYLPQFVSQSVWCVEKALLQGRIHTSLSRCSGSPDAALLPRSRSRTSGVFQIRVWNVKNFSRFSNILERPRCQRLGLILLLAAVWVSVCWTLVCLKTACLSHECKGDEVVKAGWRSNNSDPVMRIGHCCFLFLFCFYPQYVEEEFCAMTVHMQR